MFANAHRDRDKHPQAFKLAEFLPGANGDSECQGQTPEEMNAVMESMAKQMGTGAPT